MPPVETSPEIEQAAVANGTASFSFMDFSPEDVQRAFHPNIEKVPFPHALSSLSIYSAEEGKHLDVGPSAFSAEKLEFNYASDHENHWNIKLPERAFLSEVAGMVPFGLGNRFLKFSQPTLDRLDDTLLPERSDVYWLKSNKAMQGFQPSMTPHGMLHLGFDETTFHRVLDLLHRSSSKSGR